MSRYFPLSHELNNDPEVWELTDEFGDRSLRIWLEILRIMDAEKNHWKVVKGWDSVIGRKVRQTPATVRRAVGWMLARGWLVVRQPSAGGSPEVLGLRNYTKFRKIAAERTPSPNLTETKLTETKPPKSPKRGTGIADIVFERFWKIYPKKVGQGAAYKAWCKEAKHGSDTQAEIFAALEWQVTQPQWLRDGGQYIPNPSTWLNQRRWTDQKVEVSSNGSGRIAEPKGFAALREFQEIRDRQR